MWLKRLFIGLALTLALAPPASGQTCNCSFIQATAAKIALRLGIPSGSTPSTGGQSVGNIFIDTDTFELLTWNGSAWVGVLAASAAVGGGWTDDGSVVRLTTVTDAVGIGTATVGTNAKLNVVGGGIKVGAASTLDAGVHVEVSSSSPWTTPGRAFQFSAVSNAQSTWALLGSRSAGAVDQWHTLGSNSDGTFRLNQGADTITGASFVMDSAGLVGIGTATPFLGQLHVNKSATGALGGDLWITNSGTNAVGSTARLAFGPDATTDSIASAGIESIVTNAGSFLSDLRIMFYDGVGYNEKLRIQGDTGEVGIGTAAPGARLHVAGTFKLVDGSEAAGDVLTTVDGTGLATWAAPAAVDHGALTGLGDDDHAQYPLSAGRAASQTIKGGTAASETLTLMSTAHATKGKLLFGTSGYDEVNNRLGVGTNAPTAPLDARGGAVFNEDGADVDFRIEGDTDANLLATDATADRIGIRTNAPAATLDVRGSAVFNDAGGDFDFRIEGDTDAQLFAVDASADKIGIGTTTPTAKLVVTGNTDSLMTIYNTGTGAAAADFSLIRYGNSSRTWQIALGAAGSVDWAGKFYFYDQNAGQARFLLDTAGNVGIGTTAPTSRIHGVTTLNTATGNETAYSLNYTTNKATSGNDTGLLISMTDTLSPGTSLPLDVQVGAASKLSVNAAGAVVAASTIQGTVLISTAAVRLKGYTVATLPAGTVGDTAYVTDALAPTYLVTVVGGGAIVTPVFYNGAAWIAQ